ncbi:polyketide antibiotic transporter [Paenarthrobacter nitroguajacolicus]|uniref:ABC transporter permease n=1 Tax=Paenarthrobacter nitroguajacolicus TaxID=211146 RepID=UPI0015B7C06B|nr:polyketide antibiotic transporter [Paenarthrobacter nitroguajacolicus]NWL13866.1 polyketide antibiotic transporter [Paenarthrobacter nitroguajacolicus]
MRAVLRLALLQARRDRGTLAAWILGIAGLGYAAATAVTTQFGEDNERAALISVAAASPAFLFIRGLPDGISSGAVTFFQGYSFTAVLAGLMSAFLVVRHTRADEDQGRFELVGSTQVTRVTSLYATLLLGSCANVVLALAVAAGFIGAGLPVQGSFLAGTAVGSVGLFFMAAAALVAQVMPSARSANGTVAALIGGAYLIRGGGDALGTADSSLLHVSAAWPSLFSPIGWGQRIRPFTEPDTLPLLVIGAVAGVLAGVAVVLRNGRDLGASYIAADEAGAERAGTGLASMLGLAWRLQRGSLASWCFTSAALGAVAGGLGPVVRDALEGNPSVAELMSRIVPGDAGLVDLFTTAMLGIAGILAAAAGIEAVLRLRAEEAEGRAELLLSVPASRFRWLGSTLAVAAITTTAVAVAAGASAAVVLALGEAGGSSPGMVFSAALAHIPAALVFPAGTVLVFALAPRWSTPAGWGALAVALVLGQFGGLLSLPVWLQDLSPFRHSSAMPVEAFHLEGALLMTAVAIAMASAASGLIRKRDLKV